MSNRRNLRRFFVLLVIGLLAFFDIARKPRFATLTLHGSDVVQLIAAGMCFGVALASLVVFFRGPRATLPGTHP
jgi:hypothetical protein